MLYLDNFTLIALELMYAVTIWFEYYSVTQAYKANQRLAQEQDRLPLSNEILNKEKIGYFLEWSVGALLIWGLSYLLYLPYGLVWFVLALFPAFIVRNLVYSIIANLYYAHQTQKFCNQFKMNKQYHQRPTSKNEANQGGN